MYNNYATVDTNAAIDIASQYRRITVPSLEESEPNWYFDVIYSIEDFQRSDYRYLSKMFIPVECVSEFSIDVSSFSSSNLVIAREDNLVSFYEFLSRISPQDFYSSTFFRAALNGQFQSYLRGCFEGEDEEEELDSEISKITELTWFTSKEGFYRFVQRACPLIYSQIDRWKLLTELKEYSREIRVAEK